MSKNFEWKDLGLEKIKDTIKTLKKTTIKTGLLRKSGRKLAMVAFWNEFGTVHIPETPFLRSSLENKNFNNLKVIMSNELNKLYKSHDTKAFCKNIAEFHKATIKLQISSRIFDKNKTSTVKKKGFDHRLIQTGEMFNRIDYEIKQ